MSTAATTYTAKYTDRVQPGATPRPPTQPNPTLPSPQPRGASPRASPALSGPCNIITVSVNS